ncbi:MAG: SusF/SusE family outer membrane protein [Bacteroides cellulosilyticus]
MAAGTAYFPMSLVKGYAYDANTGKGEFTYTGYIPADKGFKVVATPGAWDDQWGNADSEGFTNLVNDKNSQNIKVNAAGWYTLHLNTLENKLTMKATTFETQPTEYDAVTLIYGSESVNMTKVTMEHSHVWYADITIAASCKAKFTSGDKTWGGEVFPFELIC